MLVYEAKTIFKNHVFSLCIPINIKLQLGYFEVQKTTNKYS